MTNKLLFGSSVLMTIIHYINLFKYNPKNDLLVYVYIISLITSIINHGLGHIIFKKIDRTVIRIAFFINIYLVLNIYNDTKNKYIIENALFLIIFSGLLYFLTKYIISKNNNKKTVYYIPHLLSHIFITIANIILIKEYFNNNK
jgi:hypothetical protein